MANKCQNKEVARPINVICFRNFAFISSTKNVKLAQSLAEPGLHWSSSGPRLLASSELMTMATGARCIRSRPPRPFSVKKVRNQMRGRCSAVYLIFADVQLNCPCVDFISLCSSKYTMQLRSLAERHFAASI